MKAYLYLLALVLMLPCSSLTAQTDADSISLILPLGKTIQHNYLHHNLSGQRDYGKIQLDYQQQKGNLHLPTDPYQAQQVNFSAQGFSRIHKFTLSGDFTFNKEFDDSLAYGQKNNVDKWSPFQYYAAKAGTYQRQNYGAHVAVSYALSQRLKPFFDIDYQYHWTTGSVDPRVESKLFTLKYSPGIMLDLGNTHWAAKAIFGKGNEHVNLNYKNAAYKGSLDYPDRIHYLNFGYGYSSIRDTMTTRKYQSYHGGELSMSTSIDSHTLDLKGRYERKNQDNTNDIRSNKVYNTRAYYTENTVAADALLNLKYLRSWHQIMLSATHLYGYDRMIDFSTTLNRVNYEVYTDKYSMDYSYSSLTPKIWNLTAGAAINYHRIARKDRAVSVDVENSWLDIKPYIQLRRHSASRNTFILDLQPHYKLPLSTSLAYADNALNRYIEEVVFQDFNFYALKTYGGKVQAEWITPQIASQYLVGFKASYLLDQQIQDHDRRSGLSDLQNKWRRQSLMVGISLYL